MKRMSRSVLPIVLLLFSTLVNAGAVDINNASAQQIAAELKGVGEVKAQAIVDYRMLHGPFKTVDELVQVKGIGEGVMKMNRANILLGKANNK